ncbi:DUF6660 family protein [Larkinella knui]|uniref:DUF2946 domain-containing protein n=1 Tax=Larkinella knui TaxID=2025310 RepID=A0A3P1CH24_9BACT|nr:DUF6660 family protein [Larkinella knui]RRB12565.1 hypothetical protein EHT87_20445 [Larkinella knui]
MKSLICLLMSVHLLVLSAWPCADGCLTVRVDKQNTATMASDHHQHDDDKTGADLCSPFCGCACCGTVLESTPVFHFAFAAFSFAFVRHSTFVPTLPSAPVSCWQPPQLG